MSVTVQAAVEHFTLLATSFSAVAEMHETRDGHEDLAVIYRSQASAMMTAIAFLRGVTPAQVRVEIMESLNDETPAGA